MDITDLARGLRRLEDRQQLRDLTLRYCRAIDDSDWTALRELFADQAEDAGAASGDQAVDLLRSIRSTYGRTIHTAHGQLVEFTDDDHATGMVPSHAELDIKGETVVCAMRYYDDYVRQADGWRFARRQIKFVYALPWPRMAGALTDQLPVHWPGTEAAPSDQFPGMPA
ncbi:MAG: nuclear transport factor 2 family protein [Actinobacteria bacterium]|nr:nuclear transport factor 2 family protein [Actinomycetota bacterium]